jgi:two-component system phosphate regulon sensor histidine kinase PhoR
MSATRKDTSGAPPGESRRLAAAREALTRQRLRFRNRLDARERELAEKIKRLSILYEVGHAASETLDIDELLRLIVKLAGRHLKARKASLMLVEGESGLMRINSSVGIRRWIVEKTRIRVGEGIAGIVAARGEPVFIRDIATDERFGRPSRGTYRTGSFLSAPLKRRDRVLGVLNVSDKRSQEPFTEDDFRLVMTLASEAAVAVENATLYASLREKILSLEEHDRAREKERRRLDTLINSITDGIVAVDPAGRPLYLNERARKLLDFRGDLSEGINLADVLPPGQTGELLRRGISSALGGEAARRETRASAGGVRLHLELVSLPVRLETGGALGALTVIRDVTAFKELDATRSDFLNRASHQLKTPVGLIKGFADTLALNPGMPDEQRRGFLDLVRGEAIRLADLIESLLDLARIDTGTLRVERERLSVESIFGQIVPAAVFRAGQKGITFRVETAGDLPLLETDPRCIIESVRNILDNSFKYTPRGGSVTLSATGDGGGVDITVADTGAGIDEEDLPHIFERYYVGRAGNPSGTGLGLNIARDMLNALGGSISLTSRRGQGTTVRITIPAAPVGGYNPVTPEGGSNG